MAATREARGRGAEARRRSLTRRRVFASLVVVAALGALAAVIVAGGGSHPGPAAPHPPSVGRSGGGSLPPHPSPRPAPPRPSAPFAVGLTVMRFVDPTRSVPLPNGASSPRTLGTYIRYPAQGPAGRTDRLRATPARNGGPFPLIVFGHGFNVTPVIYAPLLQAWARAGFVVAAPSFPLTNQLAAGLNEGDLPNQPADMRFIITRMLSASKAPSGLLSGLIAQHEIAVTGQSDGGDTALAVAYDPRFQDPRVGAAMILSGAEIPMLSAFTIGPGGPPLLATQGTADPTNLPSATSAFYDTAPAPKYLLELLGAVHLPPYTSPGPQLGVVERVTIAFLRHYLEHKPASLTTLLKVGDVPGVATLSASP